MSGEAWGGHEAALLRGQALLLNAQRNGHERRCAACGRVGRRVEVDHVVPRELAPELALELSNLQVLCLACHRAKSRAEAGARSRRRRACRR